MNLAQPTSLFENALTTFISDTAAANKKAQKLKQNMECRRKLEQLREEKRLKLEICEFEFEVKK